MHNQSEQVFFIRFRALGWNRVDCIATIIAFMNSKHSFLGATPGDRPKKVAHSCKRVRSKKKIAGPMNNIFGLRSLWDLHNSELQDWCLNDLINEGAQQR